MIRIRHFTFLSSLFLAAYVPATTFAAGGLNQKVVIEIDHSFFDALPSDNGAVDIYNTPSDDENKFTISLLSAEDATGCQDIRVAGATDDEAGDTPKGREHPPRYSLYDCDITNRSPRVDTILDRDELIKNGVNQVIFHNKKYGNFLELDLKIDQNKIILKNKDGQAYLYLKYWFFPSDTVMLFAPNAKRSANVMEEIRKYGESKGLIALEKTLDGFIPSSKIEQYVLFTDPKHIVTRQINTMGDIIELGETTAERIVYNAQGKTQEQYTLPIYAKFPGYIKKVAK